MESFAKFKERLSETVRIYPPIKEVAACGNNSETGLRSGLPDGVFSKNPNLGKFGRAFNWKRMAFLWSLGIYYGNLVQFMAFFVI
jgi:hypothetical protein